MEQVDSSIQKVKGQASKLCDESEEKQFRIDTGSDVKAIGENEFESIPDVVVNQVKQMLITPSRINKKDTLTSVTVRVNYCFYHRVYYAWFTVENYNIQRPRKVLYSNTPPSYTFERDKSLLRRNRKDLQPIPSSPSNNIQ
ncbi:unnamed protein product [Clavelina lepadiformis]|uniref:Uncharacterized protein n=1 Tax=Clavelina lepadiformis TaxID=159417 RepID=A0ABP0G4G6_CLALP